MRSTEELLKTQLVKRTRLVISLTIALSSSLHQLKHASLSH